MLATSALQAVAFLGLEESQHALAEATIYIATAPKSNSACASIAAAIKEVKTGRTIPFPKNLHDRHSPGITKPGSDFSYKYSHDHPDHFVAQDYLGVDKTFYQPTDQGAEKLVKERVENWRKQFQEVRRQAGEQPVAAETKTSQRCSACSHVRPYVGSELACTNPKVITQNPGKIVTVKPDYRCDSFELATSSGTANG